jgi:uncharacterized metal-binding protein
MIASAQAGKRLVGIDGCPVACTKKTMEHAGIALTDYVLITELGFEKAPHTGAVNREAVQKVKEAVKSKIIKPIRIEVK